jgi:hypothetical protein
LQRFPVYNDRKDHAGPLKAADCRREHPRLSRRAEGLWRPRGANGERA